MRALVLLHGFTGSHASWDDVRRHLDPGTEVFAPALLGHDGTAGPAGVETFDDEVDRIADLILAADLRRPHLAGYSLGGRVALGLLVRHASLFDAATLIATSPGPADAAERAARRTDDERWARLLETEGLSTFVAAWQALPLFRTQERLDEDTLERQRRIRIAHHHAGLARALRVLGQAAMPDYRPHLHAITIPVRLVVGERDAKFHALARELADGLPRARLTIVPDAGHNVPLEAPAEIARLLQEQDS